MKVVGVSGSIADPKTSQATFEVIDAIKNIDRSYEIDLIDLRDYDMEFAFGRPLSYHNDDTWNVVQAILEADIIVFGTPIYQASITGALKNLLDFFPRDAFKGKVTAMITTAGSDKHFLAGEYQLKPILTYLKGQVPVENVFVHNDYFDIETSDITDEDILKRIHKQAQGIVKLAGQVNN